MKTRLSARILLSTLFYGTLMTTATGVPLLLASHDGIALSALITDAAAAPSKPEIAAVPGAASVDAAQAQIWDRVPGAVDSGKPNVERRAARGEVPAVQQPDARRPRLEKSGPDAEMIRTGKVRTKTIKV